MANNRFSSTSKQTACFTGDIYKNLVWTRLVSTNFVSHAVSTRIGFRRMKLILSCLVATEAIVLAMSADGLEITHQRRTSFTGSLPQGRSLFANLTRILDPQPHNRGEQSGSSHHCTSPPPAPSCDQAAGGQIQVAHHNDQQLKTPGGTGPDPDQDHVPPSKQNEGRGLVLRHRFLCGDHVLERRTLSGAAKSGRWRPRDNTWNGSSVHIAEQIFSGCFLSGARTHWKKAACSEFWKSWGNGTEEDVLLITPSKSKRQGEAK